MAKKQAAKADEDGFPVVRLTKIAPRKHDGADGMYATEVADSVEQLDEAAAFLRREIEASQSLEWVRELRDKWEKHFGPHVDPCGVPLFETGREVYQIADSILREEFLGHPLPEIARRFYNLGRATQRLELQATFDRMVRSAKTVAKSAKANAESRQTLTDTQWRKVFAYIEARPKGVSVAQRCRDASSGLLTGTLPKLSGVRVEIGDSRIRKKYDNRKP